MSNPHFYIAAFAWLSLVALACSVFTSYWLPMLVGAVVVTVLLRLALPVR